MVGLEKWLANWARDWPSGRLLINSLESLRKRVQKKQHCFSYVEGQIRCSLCNFFRRKGDVNHRECDGLPKANVEAIRGSQTKGCSFKAAGGEGRLCSFWCTRCGSHARTVPRGLVQKCSGVPTKAGAWALQLTRQGRGPKHHASNSCNVQKARCIPNERASRHIKN